MTRLSVEVPAVQRALVGNLLTANQASIETDTTGFFSFGSPTLTSVASQPQHGSKVLRLVATDSIAVELYISGGQGHPSSLAWPVTQGVTYTTRFNVRQTSGTRTVTARMVFRDAAGTVVGSASEPPVTATSTSTERTITATAPTGAVWLAIQARAEVGSIGDTLEFDQFGFWVGAGGDWAMPGTPIANLGLRVSRPNVDDYLCRQWSSAEGKWVSTRYDTGRRALTLANGWTATTADLRRHNGKVELLLVGLNGASSSSPAIVTLGSAFGPPVALGVHWIGDTATTVPNHIVSVSTAGVVSVNGVHTNITAGTAIIRFDTEAALPTSLPGTLVSAAPA